MILYCTRCGILTHFLSMGFDLLIYFCACVCSHKSGLSPTARNTMRREREKRKKRKRCRSIRVIYIHFFIMKYFKNKLNTWKETSPANLDGLGVQGHQRETQLIFFLLLRNVLNVFCHKKGDYEWKFSFLSQSISWGYYQNFWLEIFKSSMGKYMRGKETGHFNQPVLRSVQSRLF